MGEARPTRDTVVCLTFDFDATSLWLSMGFDGARQLSRGEFGASTGAGRLLTMCERLGISSTWFTPGHTADTYPDITRQVVEHGHELANHGYLHEDFAKLDEAAARDAIRRGSDALERISGTRPYGARLPGSDIDGALLELLVTEGFTYDSSLFGEDQPRWCRSKDLIADPSSGAQISHGSPLDLVELPITFMLSDFVYFDLNFAAPGGPGSLRDPADVERIWRAQFDALYDSGDGGNFMLMLHPQAIGWRSRMAMLERFLTDCRSRPNVRFETCRQAAERFRAESNKQGEV